MATSSAPAPSRSSQATSEIRESRSVSSDQVSPRSVLRCTREPPDARSVTTATEPGRATMPGRTGAGAGATRSTVSSSKRPAGSQPAPPLLERNSTGPRPAYQVRGWYWSTARARTSASGASSTTNRTDST